MKNASKLKGFSQTLIRPGIETFCSFADSTNDVLARSHHKPTENAPKNLTVSAPRDPQSRKTLIVKRQKELQKVPKRLRISSFLKLLGQQYATDITRRVKNAMYSYDYNREQETPVGLLEAALKKLKHERMDPTSVNISDYSKAMKIARAIQARATELENQFYLQQKKHKQLIRKYKRK